MTGSLPAIRTVLPSSVARLSQEIALLTDVGEVKGIRDKAEALRAFARQAGLGLEAQNDFAEIKLEAERRAGELLLNMDKHPGAATRLHDATSLPSTYEELGIEKTQAHRWQILAGVSLAAYREWLAKVKEAGGEITSVGLYEMARGHVPRLMVSSDSYEWYTPAIYIEAAREVLGGIDLDPASSAKANTIVKATRFFDEDEDGLSREWYGRVWLNPPYCGRAGPFVYKMLEEYQAGRTEATIALLNGYATDVSWFKGLWNHLLCFIDHRIKFIEPDTMAPKSGSTTASVFVYLGRDRERFADVFSRFGAVVARWRAGCQPTPMVGGRR